MLIVVLYFGCRISSPEHLTMITKTSAASTIFGANIELLAYKKGYWDLEIKANSFLHLWSLGVEEQFYIFWPFFITICMNKLPLNKLLYIMMVFTLSSFCFNIFASFYISDKFDFYFPLCRFWQMSIGGLIVFDRFSFKSKITQNTAMISAILGMCLWTLFFTE